jgi:predicted nucleotidyltransferase
MENNQIIENTIIELVANSKKQVTVVDLLINYINSLTDDEKEEFMERAEIEIII